jgi:hypothetical protein
MLALAEEQAGRTLVRSTKGIQQCYVLPDKESVGRGNWLVQTDGVNFRSAWAMSHLVDVNALTRCYCKCVDLIVFGCATCVVPFEDSTHFSHPF